MELDDLEMKYNGNQLKSVNDYAGNSNLYNTKEYQNKSNSTNEMAYDANGNLIKDLDRDIVTIKYNLLNLPEIIQFKNGNQIRNLYDASGQKLSTRNVTIVYYITQPIISCGDLFDFNDMAQDDEEIYIDFIDNVGNVEYTHFESYYEGDYYNHYDTYDLSRVYNNEGFSDWYSFSYYRKDHLGNNREVWRAPYTTTQGATVAAATIQRTQYYPSGLPWASNSGDNPQVQSKKYNGKEFVEMHGLDVTDMGWRGQFPAINRFTTRDRKAEQFPWQSPYCVANNNTVRFVDKKGENAGEPESGGTPTIQTAKKTTEGQSTARRDVPEKIKPIKATVALVQKTQAAALAKGAKLNQGTLSKAPSKLEKYMNVVCSPQDRLLSKNPVIQVAAVTVAAPALITVGENAAVWVEVSSKAAVGVGLLEGYIKSKIENSPPDMPYTFESLPLQVTSEAYQQLNPIIFPNSVKK